MPDLSSKAAHEFWKTYHDPMIYKVLTFMEGVEEWTIDGDAELETAIEKLGQVLDDTEQINLGHEEQFIKVAAYLKITRVLRLLQCLDTANPGSASKVLMHAEENTKTEQDVPGLFLRRNIVFERLRLLARVFSTERLALVAKGIEHEENI